MYTWKLSYAIRASVSLYLYLNFHITYHVRIYGFQLRDFLVLAAILRTTKDRMIECTVSAFNWFEGKWLAKLISPRRKSSTMLQKQVF